MQPNRIARPNADGKKRYAGVDEVRFVELPLGMITDGEALRRVVEATIKFAGGDHSPILAIRNQWEGPKTNT